LDDVQVRVDATITGAASAERYAQLHAAVEAHCPVQDMLTGTVHVKSELTVG
jgi:putative redox protein